MKRIVTTSLLADDDYQSILRYSILKFGMRLADHYIRLIDQAIDDLAIQPDRPGVMARFDIREGLYYYHLKHSVRGSGPRAQRIRKPRHVLVFHLPHENHLMVARILHDKMQLDHRKLRR
jgi:toxin ParE1/3/4